LELIAPLLSPAPSSNGQFLVAGLFPLTPGKTPAPSGLWSQFEGRTNLVFYDWELTGPRVRHLITVAESVPILQMLGIGPTVTLPPGASPARPGPKVSLPAGVQSRLDAEKKWLLGLTPYLANTATEVTKTGPNELTVLRSSPFVFSSLELVLLSHWLSDTPAGPLDWSLLPQAKMTMGMPAH
jgi:hypothetical protein